MWRNISDPTQCSTCCTICTRVAVRCSLLAQHISDRAAENVTAPAITVRSPCRTWWTAWRKFWAESTVYPIPTTTTTRPGCESLDPRRKNYSRRPFSHWSRLVATIGFNCGLAGPNRPLRDLSKSASIVWPCWLCWTATFRCGTAPFASF